MSCITSRVKEALTGQRGHALVLSLIVVAITAALSVPLLAFTSSVLQRSTAPRVSLTEQYSVGAATEDAIWRVANDPEFLAELLALAPGERLTDTLMINGEEVLVEIWKHAPSGPPPAPMPTPTPQPGVDVTMTTFIDPPTYNLAAPPDNVSMTLYLRNLGSQSGGGSNATVHEVIVALPKGFGYAGGLDWNENLLQQGGDPFELTEPKREWADPMPFPRHLTGKYPFQNCTIITRNDGLPSNSMTPVDDDSEWERVVWGGDEGGHWPNNPARPRIDQQTVAAIDFDIDFAGWDQPSLGFLPDNPWWHVHQNNCNPPTTYEAGLPSGILVFLTYRIWACQGNTELISDAMVSDNTRILSQQYGRVTSCEQS